MAPDAPDTLGPANGATGGTLLVEGFGLFLRLAGELFVGCDGEVVVVFGVGVFVVAVVVVFVVVVVECLVVVVDLVVELRWPPLTEAPPLVGFLEALPFPLGALFL